MELVVDNESLVDRAWRKLEQIGYERPTDNGNDDE
jgi:hypothetical protein